MHKRCGHADRLDELSRLRAAIAASGDILYEWDLADDAILWHGDSGRIAPPHRAQPPASGEALNTQIHPEDLPLRLKMLSDHIATGAPYDCEFRLRRGDGTYLWVHDRGGVDTLHGGAALHMIGAMRVVTERKENEAYLEFLANYDELTGHFNKMRLRQALDQALVETVRVESAGAFLVLGIDQLAMINNAYGFEAGDAVLVEVGHRLDACLRNCDVIGRIAGDRFGAVLGRCDQKEALRVAERAVAEIRSLPIDTPAGEVRITATVGVVVFPTQASSGYDVIAKAEGALRQAKARGRNCVGLYEMSEEQRRSYRAALDIGAEVHQALKESRLSFAYQPIVGSRNHAVDFYECLLRLRREDGTLVTAGAFVPTIEQLGLMRALDRRVLDLAVEDLRKHPQVRLAINISGLTASDRSWLRALTAKLKGKRDLASRLVVEITETAALQDIEESARFVRAVRALGCRVALDDFGAGYTTFRHLKTLTVDIVKIDGSFVRNIAQEPQNLLFVRNLLGLSRSLNLVAVAECIETEEEARILQDEGAELLQGYYFGRPALEHPWLHALPETVNTPAPDKKADQVVPFKARGAR